MMSPFMSLNHPFAAYQAQLMMNGQNLVPNYFMPYLINDYNNYNDNLGSLMFPYMNPMFGMNLNPSINHTSDMNHVNFIDSNQLNI